MCCINYEHFQSENISLFEVKGVIDSIKITDSFTLFKYDKGELWKVALFNYDKEEL